MDSTAILARQGHRLLQVGVALLLLTSFWGFLFPNLAAPQLGLSAHKLASLQAALFLGLGLIWPRLSLSEAASRTAVWLFAYSAFAILVAYLLGAIWGAGNETMRLAAGSAHGTDAQETAIKVAAYSSAPTGIVSFGLIFWGLRKGP